MMGESGEITCISLEGLGQTVMVVGQVSGAGLTVAVPVGVHDLGVQWAAGDVGGGDVVLLLGQQILEEGGTYKTVATSQKRRLERMKSLNQLTSQNEGKEGDGESLQRDELDDGEQNLDDDRLLQFQSQQQRQQHLLHALAAGFCGKRLQY